MEKYQHTHENKSTSMQPANPSLASSNDSRHEIHEEYYHKKKLKLVGMMLNMKYARNIFIRVIK
jgi:hypothetical protein